MTTKSHFFSKLDSHLCTNACMKSNSKESDNWLKFRKIFDCISAIEDDNHSSFIELIPALDKFLTLAPSILFIIDYSTMQYLYFNENLNDYVGNVAENYLKGGVEFAILNVHPEDREKLVYQIFPHIKEYLNKVPPETYKDYKFSFNFRYKRKDGTYQAFMQHSTYLPDKAGKLRYNYGMGSNLPPGNDHTITLTIEKKGAGSYQPVSLDTFAAGSKNIFTKRESEILKLIHEGLSSAAIADKLCLSEHTIKNHRKKMLQKSGTANTAALINYALSNGFL